MNPKWQSQIVSDEVSADGTPGGGAPAVVVETPPTAPAVVPAATEAPVASSNVDWDEVAGEDVGSGDETPPPAEVVPPAESKPVVPETPPAEVPPVVAAPPTETPPTQPTPPVQTQVTHEEIQKQIRESREAFTKQLETNYAVPEASVPNLVAEPEKVLPVLFAQAHMKIMDQVADYIHQMLPQMLRATQQQETQAVGALKQFYDAWPELQDAKYTDTVARQLVAYRQANPTAKSEDVIHEGGISALVALRLPIPDRIMKVHNAGTPSATPSTPFTPASASGSAPSAPPQAGPTNAFAILAQEDLAENV